MMHQKLKGIFLNLFPGYSLCLSLGYGNKVEYIYKENCIVLSMLKIINLEIISIIIRFGNSYVGFLLRSV